MRWKSNGKVDGRGETRRTRNVIYFAYYVLALLTYTSDYTVITQSAIAISMMLLYEISNYTNSLSSNKIAEADRVRVSNVNTLCI